MTTKYSDNFLTISTQSESSREYDTALKTNEVDLIKTKLEHFLAPGTFDICGQQLRSQDALKLIINIQRSSVNIMPAELNGLTTI